MLFVDEATIEVTAGNGGNGCVSFLRQRNRPKGGPDGGNGGKGGSVYLQATNDLNTLVDFRYQPKYTAKNGIHGSGANKNGAQGVDIYIKIPVGTCVYSAESGVVLDDFRDHNHVVCIAAGGKGGIGNIHFKSSINRSPRQSTTGVKGEYLKLFMQLRLIADVGLLGLPNAGKSTLIRAVSAATPKVADYPFTTLIPNLGTVRIAAGNSFLIADIPGIIAGASVGKGLGLEFLRHIARTNLLLHLLDVCGEQAVEEQYFVIENELKKSSAVFLDKQRWVVLNKSDTVSAAEIELLQTRITKITDIPIWVTSAATKDGCQALMHAVSLWLQAEDERRRNNAEYNRAQNTQIDQIAKDIQTKFSDNALDS